MNSTHAFWLFPAILLATSFSCGKAKPPSEAAPSSATHAEELPSGLIRFPADSPKLKLIEVKRVTQSEVPTEEVTAPATVEANLNRTTHVSLPVPGRIITVSVVIGDFVRKGSPLLTVESPDVDVALSNHLQALAGKTQAKSAVSKAQADLDRVRDLFAHDAVAQKEVINAAAILTQSTAALDQAKAAVEQTHRRLLILGVEPGKFGQFMSIQAPISGKILEMNIVPGEYRNDVSQSVMTIADLSSVWITADIPESSIRLVRGNEPVRIELAAYPGESFTGRVKQIADLVDPQTRTIKVRVEMLNRDGRLRPQMFGRIRLTGAVGTRPVVPVTAVVEGAGQNIVWRENEPGLFQKVPVTLGERAGDHVAILNGLNPGDRVVTDGVMLLQTN